MSVEILDNRTVQDRIMREVASLARAVVTIGIHQQEETRQGGDITNPQLGAVHEFGSDHIPERSFLRSTVDSGKPMEFAEKVAAKVAQGQLSAHQAANQVGVTVVGQVQQTIKAKIPPPLSDRTLKTRMAKGAHGGGVGAMGGAVTPLIDSGQLYASIQHKVEGV